MRRLGQDIRFALRALRRHPGFTAIALLTIALGIGVNTAIFSVVNGVLIESLPYPESDRLYTVWEDEQARGGPATEWTGRSTFADWRQRNRTFEGMTAVTGWAPNLTGSDRAEVLQGALVTPGFFSVLGVEPAMGRGFLPEEETPGNDAVVVLSHELWQERFGGDPALGEILTLNGTPHVIVGIARPGFQDPILRNARLWSVLPIDAGFDDRGNHYIRVIGRLSGGSAIDEARADMARVAAGIAEAHPVEYGDVGVTLEPLRDTVVGPVRTPLLVLLGTVSLVLLIACANVANLLLARATVRQRELAVRASLGAGRGRIVGQLLTESVVLALGGGLLGLGLGAWGTSLLLRIAPPGLPRLGDVGLDGLVFLYALGASLVTGLLFGLAPALGNAARSSASALRDGERGSSAGSGERLRAALVVGEVALGVAVLFAAGLLLRSFGEMQRVDPGFDVEGALSGRILFSAADYPDVEAIPMLLDRLEERLEGRPGVTSAGSTTLLPLGGNVNDVSFGVEGDLPPPGRAPLADLWRATPGFFEAMRIPLLGGRYLDETDRPGGPLSAVVSRSLAEAHFRGEDPVGRRIRVGSPDDADSPWWTIVGVVETVRTRAVAAAPEPEIFISLGQRPARGINVVVRTDGDPAALATDLREAVAALDPNLPVSGVATLEEVFAASIAPQRFVSRLLGTFAALALVLGAVGIYGVMAFRVSQQRREIGIRMALGAAPRTVLRSVMRRGLLLTGIGLALGIVVAVAAGRALSSLLFEVRPNDPATLIAVAALLAGAAILASWGPARRATRVDPMITLRAE